VLEELAAIAKEEAVNKANDEKGGAERKAALLNRKMNLLSKAHIRKIAKSCPKCHIPIEKDGG
jgi:hypothetical protein